ncbi:hypothetical protein SUDANB15_02059 [Streptomyces sp. enrichment culture]
MASGPDGPGGRRRAAPAGPGRGVRAAGACPADRVGGYQRRLAVPGERGARVPRSNEAGDSGAAACTAPPGAPLEQPGEGTPAPRLRPGPPDGPGPFSPVPREATRRPVPGGTEAGGAAGTTRRAPDGGPRSTGAPGHRTGSAGPPREARPRPRPSPAGAAGPARPALRLPEPVRPRSRTATAGSRTGHARPGTVAPGGPRPRGGRSVRFEPGVALHGRRAVVRVGSRAVRYRVRPRAPGRGASPPCRGSRSAPARACPAAWGRE